MMHKSKRGDQGLNADQLKDVDRNIGGDVIPEKEPEVHRHYPSETRRRCPVGRRAR